MITLERTQDMNLVRSIATDVRIWDQMADDFSGDRESYDPPADGAVYVLVKEDGEVRGMWVLVPRSQIRYEIHTLLLPELRGFRALDAAARMASWVWQNTPCQSLVTEIPECNPRALWFAKTAGMVPFGREPKCFRKGGTLYDVALLGMHRPEVTSL